MKWFKKTEVVEPPAEPQLKPGHRYDINSIKGQMRTKKEYTEIQMLQWIDGELHDALVRCAAKGEEMLSLNLDMVQKLSHGAGGLDRVKQELEERGFTISTINSLFEISGWADGQE